MGKKQRVANGSSKLYDRKCYGYTHDADGSLTIDVMLSNEKYTGTVRLLDSDKHEMQYVSENNNPAIISKETFQAVQIEKAHRSNVAKVENENQRKSKKYSSKK